MTDLGPRFALAHANHSLRACVHACISAVSAVKILEVLIPDKAIIHSRVRLSCLLDLEQDELYSLKWYLNGSEVASFMPSRNQSFEVFAASDVPITASSDVPTDLLIPDVMWACEGTWVCEVFADTSFQRDHGIGQLLVIGKCGPSLSLSRSLAGLTRAAKNEEGCSVFDASLSRTPFLSLFVSPPVLLLLYLVVSASN